jgi:transcriptional regulator of acetoin/glycerol metabolism
MSKKTKDIFSWYHWPGNVKELYIIIKNAIMLGNEIQILDQPDQNNQTHDSTNLIDGVKDAYGLLELSDLKQYLMDLNKVSLKDICRKFIARTEKNLMKKALEKTNWNRKKAANLLDISYKSMLNKIKAYNIT